MQILAIRFQVGNPYQIATALLKCRIKQAKGKKESKIKGLVFPIHIMVYLYKIINAGPGLHHASMKHVLLSLLCEKQEMCYCGFPPPNKPQRTTEGLH